MRARNRTLYTVLVLVSVLLAATASAQVPGFSKLFIEELFIDGVPIDFQLGTDIVQCATHAFSAQISGEVPPVSYFWDVFDNNNETIIASSNDPVFVFDVGTLGTGGSFDVGLLALDTAGGKDADFRPLNVVPAPDLTFDGRECSLPGEPCNIVDGNTITLFANSTGAQEWQWEYREVGAPSFTVLAPFGVGQPIESVTLPSGDYEFRVGIQNCFGKPLFGTTFATVAAEPDPLIVSLSGPQSVEEGDGEATTATYTATLSESTGPGLTVTVSYAATSLTATAGQDFPQTFGSVVFTNGVRELEFEVPIIGDELIEGNETFTVHLTEALPSSSEALVTIGRGSTVTTIIDDDTFEVSFETGAAISVDEGDAGTTTPAEVVVSVSPAPSGSQNAIVNFETVAGTATAGEDYVETSGTIVFGPGVTSQRVLLRRAGLGDTDRGLAPGGGETITIDVIGDDEIENDETFQLVLSAGNEETSIGGDGAATFVIEDDDVETDPIDVRTTQTVSTEGDPEGPSVVLSLNGNSVVAWERNSGAGQEVVLQFFGPDGEPLSDIVRVSGPGFASSPSVVFTSSGNALIVWLQRSGSAFVASDGSVSLAGSTGTSILGRTFDQSGGAQSDTTEIATGGEDDELEPEVEIDADGDVIVTWEADGAVNIQTLDESAQPTGEPTTIPVSEGTMASSPSVARNSLGASVTVWRAEGGSQPGILALRADQNGDTVGGVIVVTPETSASSPHVAIDPFGGFFVTWQQDGESGSDVMARAFDPQGNPLGDPAPVGSTNGEETDPHVSSNTTGDYLIVWTSSGGTTGGGSAGSSILGRTFSNSGEETSDETVIAVTDAVGDPQNGEGDIDEDDSGVVVFERRGPDGSSEGVFKTEIQSNPPPRDCIADATTVCLGGGRLEVIVEFQTSSSDQNRAQAVPITPESTAFWFFEPDNLEVVVKVVDGCVVNSRAWVFTTGLTDVDVNVIVTDTQTGASKSYVSSAGAFRPIFDTSAFNICQ